VDNPSEVTECSWVTWCYTTLALKSILEMFILSWQ